jgi:ABC-type transporter Mla subunit MlaD
MTDDLRPRLEAVERAVTDGETDLGTLADAASVERRLTAVEERLDSLEERLDSLDATTQAVRGYLGGVDGVTEDVERQAALALAKAEAVESHVFDADDRLAVERLPPAAEDPQRRPASRTRGTDSDSRRSTAARPPADAPDDTDRSSAGAPDDDRTERRPSPSALASRLRDVL